MTGDNNLYTAATVAAVFHLINHATFKGSLFMAAGIIDHETGTRDIRKLGGLLTLMPVTATISLIGLASMAGLPPFNGFLSKELFLTALVNVTDYGIFHLETLGNFITDYRLDRKYFYLCLLCDFFLQNVYGQISA